MTANRQPYYYNAGITRNAKCRNALSRMIHFLFNIID